MKTTLSHGTDTLPGPWHRGFIAGAALLMAVWALLQPQPSCAGSGVKLNVTAAPGGRLLLHLQGQPSQAYEIQASTDLKTWIPVSTNLVSSGTASYTDASAKVRPLRYYRAFIQ